MFSNYSATNHTDRYTGSAMRTRNTDTPKSAATAKKTPPSAKKTPPFSTEPCAQSAATNTAEPKRSSAGRAKTVKATLDAKPESSVEQATPSTEASLVTLEAKPVSGTKIVRKVVRKVIKKRTPISAKASSSQTSKPVDSETEKIEDPMETKIMESSDKPEAASERLLVPNVEACVVEDKNIGNQESSMGMGEKQKRLIENVEELQEDVMDVKSTEIEEHVNQIKTQDEKEQKRKTLAVDDTDDEMKRVDASLEETGDERIEGLSDQEVHEEFGGEDFADEDVPEHGAEAETLKEEHVELNAVATERKVRKEREIFVGGLDRDAVEEDIRKVFQHAGEVIEVRIHMDPLTNKNKGYAFVQFATKEQARRALSEMKNPVIHGKRCGTATSEDNDTLFLGNICNTWTREAIKQKLKDYGIEGVENITLVADPRHEGLSRGFAFIEFSSHAEAMLAYKRLQKPDVIFGHHERTAKVAFAEPLREPDPEVMAQVKSIFIDGLPPHWDEDHVREKFGHFGEIVRIMLARNMSTAKRKDFGFVDFCTHEAAVSCVEGINRNGISDGDTKVKVHARLSNPLPKMQAVKGGMCGGFRIGYGGSGTFHRFSGRGSGRGAHPSNRANYQRGRGFYPHGPGHGGRMGFPGPREFDSGYPSFHGRQHFERGERWGFRGAYQGSVPSRSYPDRARHVEPDRVHGDYDPFGRQSDYFEEGYNGPFMERHFDDPYLYAGSSRTAKRPYYMMDQDPDLLEASRHRPRLEHSDPSISLHETRYRDDLAADGGFYSQNSYGSDYGGGAYSPYYGGDRPYRHGYYY